jgi:cytochrome c5
VASSPHRRAPRGARTRAAAWPAHARATSSPGVGTSGRVAAGLSGAGQRVCTAFCTPCHAAAVLDAVPRRHVLAAEGDYGDQGLPADRASEGRPLCAPASRRAAQPRRRQIGG